MIFITGNSSKGSPKGAVMEFIRQALSTIPVFGGGLLAPMEGELHSLLTAPIKLIHPFPPVSVTTTMSQSTFCEAHNQTEGQAIFFRPMEPHVIPAEPSQHQPQTTQLLTKRRSAEVSLPPLPLLDPKRTKLSHSE
jgi:hypothetical protein